jgi:regulator of replication initiation timing
MDPATPTPRFGTTGIADLLAPPSVPSPSKPGSPKPPTRQPSPAKDNAAAASAAMPSAPSPEPLESISMPTEYGYKGTIYDTFEQAVSASATELNIPQNYVDWMTGVVEVIVQQKLAAIYNQLGGKMYEHKAGQEQKMAILEELGQRNADLIDQALNLEKDVCAMSLELNSCLQDVNMLKQENQILHQDQNNTAKVLKRVLDENQILKTESDALRRDLSSLAASPAAFASVPPTQSAPVNAWTFTQQAPWQPTAPNQAPTTATATTAPVASAPFTQSMASQLRNIPSPPKFSGSSDKNAVKFEEWLLKCNVYFRHIGCTDDTLCITNALMLLEGNAAAIMLDYATLAGTNQPLGTWQDFITRLETAFRQLSPDKAARQQLEA